MTLSLVQRYKAPDLAVQVDSGARTVLPGTNVTFTTDPVTGAITINGTGGAGTVTSVNHTGSTGLTIGGTNPITTSGTTTFTLSANLQSWSGIAPASKYDTSNPAGYITSAALGPYVLKAGDTMSGLLTVQYTGAEVRVADTTAVAIGNGGMVNLRAMNNSSVQVDLGRVKGWLTDGTAGSEAAELRLYYRNAGALALGATLTTDGAVTVQGAGANATRVGPWATIPATYMSYEISGAGANDYTLLHAPLATDPSTYLNAKAGGSVRVTADGNNAATATTFGPTGVDMLLPLTIGSGKKISKVTLSSAAPAVLTDGELFLRY